MVVTLLAFNPCTVFSDVQPSNIPCMLSTLLMSTPCTVVNDVQPSNMPDTSTAFGAFIPDTEVSDVQPWNMLVMYWALLASNSGATSNLGSLLNKPAKLSALLMSSSNGISVSVFGFSPMSVSAFASHRPASPTGISWSKSSYNV